MTRSKLEFATILATLRGQGEDPAQLAQDMTLRKLCYEIEKIEEEAAQPPPEPEPEEPKEEPPKTTKAPRAFWSRLNLEDSDSD